MILRVPDSLMAKATLPGRNGRRTAPQLNPVVALRDSALARPKPHPHMATKPRCGRRGMEDLRQYLNDFVEPTIADFENNPASVRHAFLACVVTFHSADYLAHPRRPAA